MKPFVIALGLLIAACNKPSADDCKSALLNMQHLLGTDQNQDETRLEAAIRGCKSASTKESVQCAINAKSVDQLQQCGFTHLAGSAAPKP
jgi:hypothetical protein